MPDSILRRISAGDQAAVRECISRHGGLVWSLARRFSASQADAEDAVQEIFIDLWTHAARYDPALASETTFVAIIARRKLIDRRRKQGRRPHLDALPDEIPGLGLTPLDRVEQLDEVGRASRALESLADQPRRVLTLAIYHGMTYDEIARQTGLPLGTVKTHARRGLIQLRRDLDAPASSPSLARKGGES